MKKNLLIWLALVFTVVYLYATPPTENESQTGTVSLVVANGEITQGNTVALEILNKTAANWKYENDCFAEPFRVYRYENGDWRQLEAEKQLPQCDENLKEKTLAAGEQTTIDYGPWTLALFYEKGRYQIRADLLDADGNRREFISNDFNVVAPSFLTNLWRELLYRPFYNSLLFFTKYLPWHSLGLAIILLTVLIRLLLLAPSQKAMKAQKAMQEIQPKLRQIKEKYKGDQQRLAQETMRIWRENKVNPLGSCLPILIQFPVLIALFYVVQGGLDPNNVYLLYSPLRDFDFSLIQTDFLGLLDLTKIDFYVLPLIIGLLQFVQMKLAMAKSGGPKLENKPTPASGEPDLAAVNNMMLYMMPVLIAVFTASLPAGVGLYWGVSTLFGIVQQLVVNKSPGKSQKNGSEVSVKVIN